MLLVHFLKSLRSHQSVFACQEKINTVLYFLLSITFQRTFADLPLPIRIEAVFALEDDFNFEEL